MSMQMPCCSSPKAVNGQHVDKGNGRCANCGRPMAPQLSQQMPIIPPLPPAPITAASVQNPLFWQPPVNQITCQNCGKQTLQGRFCSNCGEDPAVKGSLRAVSFGTPEPPRRQQTATLRYQRKLHVEIL